MNKYHAKKTVYDGITFDSKHEAERYAFLKTLEKAGKIYDLRRQVSFVLQPSFLHNGKLIREITYRADFVYMQNGRMIVEDAKGMKTQLYQVKKKMFLNRYGFEIREV